MKTIKLTLLALAIVIAADSCKKDSITSNPPYVDNQSIAFNINNANFTGNTAFARYYTSTDVLEVVDFWDLYHTMEFTIKGFKNGTYNLGKNDAGWSGPGYNFESLSGTVVITEVNKVYVTGTFQFTGSDVLNKPDSTIAVTGGSFNISYDTEE
jgi:Family of unknown function (DUF6252)